MQWSFASPLKRGLAPVKAQPPLLFGSAIHAALESFYDPQYDTRDPHRALAAFDAYMEAWYNSLDGPGPEDDEQYESMLRLGKGMLDHYFRVQAPQDDFEVLWVEREYIIPIEGVPNAVYTFKPDGLLRDKSGRYWIFEHKTADKLYENTDYLLMDEQCGSYIKGLELAEGISIEGVLYNVLRKKVPTPLKVLKNETLSRDMRTDTTYEYAKAQIKAYYEGLIPNAYQDFLEHVRGKGNTFFYRENVRRNPRELDFLWESVKAQAREMLDPNTPIYRNPSKSNCGYCAFVGPCLAIGEGSDHESMLATNYAPSGR